MLKSLRRKLSMVIALLVGMVLACALGSSFYTTWSTQRDIVTQSLEMALMEDTHAIPRMGEDREMRSGGPQGARTNLLILSIDLSEDGIVLDTNDAPVVIDSSLLSSVLDEALGADDDSKWDTELHVAWKRLERADGSWRVVLADTSAIDLSVRDVGLKYVLIFVVSMLGIVVIAIFLSRWMVRPVEMAWDQQRRFVADASHELKTPLAVIMANTQILERGDEVLPEGRRWVHSTADEAAHMKGLVEELLELARTDEVTAGSHGAMRGEQVDFSSLVENAALEFDAVAFERGCTIEEQVERGIVVKGDQEWLSRLCKILIDNACKYAQEGSSIDVELRRETKRCVLRVTNQGNAIDPQDLPHLFDRFYRADTSRSRDTGGYGIGLSVARAIAQSHGGDITALRDGDKIIRFVVKLPKTFPKGKIQAQTAPASK